MQRILAEPDDDAHRLAWAQAVEEEQPERSEFVKVQIKLAMVDDRGEAHPGQPNPDCDICKGGRRGYVQARRDTSGKCIETIHVACAHCWAAFRRRERELLRRTGNWLPEIGALVRHTMVSTPDDWWHAAWDTGNALIGADFSRGFPSRLTLSWADWCAHAAALLAACPIRHAADGLVRLTTWPDVESYREAFGHYPIIPSIGPPPVPGDGSGYEWATVLPLCWPGVRFELPAPNLIGRYQPQHMHHFSRED